MGEQPASYENKDYFTVTNVNDADPIVLEESNLGPTGEPVEHGEEDAEGVRRESN